MGHLQKEGLRPNPKTPKTILDRNSAYKLRTKSMEFPKLRTFKVRAPTRFNHESCLKSTQFELLKCLISCNFNRFVMLDKISFEKHISVINVEKVTLSTNNGTTV